jgi:hypothetical protein
MRALCVDCGNAFYREEDERWKVRCITCFKKSKRADLIPVDSNLIARAQAAEERAAMLHEKFERQKLTIQILQRELEEQRARRYDSGLDRELAEQLPRLLMVAHPDRHNGSQAATKATQWLLDVRGRLTCA